jgi:hypothetical protein
MADDYGLLDNYEQMATCSQCETELEWVECEQCDGEGMSGHDCGEDCCCCLDPEPNELCDLCGGAGGWYWCYVCHQED